MISTTTALTSSTNPSTYHSTVTFTATITPGSGGEAAMTGTVTFFNGNVSIGSATVTWNSGTSTGQATLTTAALPGGSPSITAAYSGDGNYSNSASSALTQTVNAMTSTVALTLSAPAPVYGQPVTITADVGSSSWGILPATGTITFKDGGTTLGTAPLVATLDSSGPVGQAGGKGGKVGGKVTEVWGARAGSAAGLPPPPPADPDLPNEGSMARLRPWLSQLRRRPYGAADARLASGGWLGPAGWDWLPTGLLRKVSKTTSYPPFLSFSWRKDGLHKSL